MRLKINDSEIVWPGRESKKPEGIMIPTHLKVLTIEEKPFVYVRRLTEDEKYCEEDEIPCPYFNSTDGKGRWFASLFLFTIFIPVNYSSLWLIS